LTSLATARQSAGVSYQRAKNAGAEWIVAAKLPLDLRGHVLDLVTFATEEDCRFFYPRRALIWQQMVNTAIKKQLSRRALKINSIVITREHTRGGSPAAPTVRSCAANSQTAVND